jgi:hypothetical protein
MTLDRLPARAVGTEAAATVHQLLNDRLDPEALAQPSWQQPALATAWAPWYLPGIGADPAVGDPNRSRRPPSPAQPADRRPISINSSSATRDASGAGAGRRPTRVGQPLIPRASSVTNARRSR